MTEEVTRGQPHRVVIRGGRVWSDTVEEVAGTEETSAWSAGDVVLITGGTGGLGRLLAVDAVRAGASQVVVAGRGPRTEKIESWLASDDCRGVVEYRRADLTRRDETFALVDGIIFDHGRLNVLVHAAGVVADDLLARASKASLRAVLSPKVAGALHLDEAVGTTALDRFILVGSLAGVTGNVGQAIGFYLSVGQLYWLAAMPGLSCGLIRLVYMFLPPIVGTRKLVGWSSLLYILPMAGWFFAVQDSTTGYGVLLGLAFACGIGGGSFSGYMPSTGYFFPKRLSGTALGIQAGVGNLGMSIIQLLSPWLMGFGLLGITWIAPQQAGSGLVWVHNAAVFFIPWTIVAALLAFTLLKDVPVKANIRQQIDIFSNPDTWYMTLMYVATFGLFSGFAAQFGLLIKNTYGPSKSDQAVLLYLPDPKISKFLHKFPAPQRF